MSDIKRLNDSTLLAEQGDSDAEQDKWVQAEKCYQEALTIWPDNAQALYGMGRCAQAAGSLDVAIRYYRSAVYPNPPHGSSYEENNAGRLMEYVLLLSQAGQQKEALAVYRRAAHVLNFLDGKPNLVVPLPDFAPGELAPTPNHLQAMAHIGLAIYKDGFDTAAVEKHLQQAVALAPDSPLPFFYRGKHESDMPAATERAKTDFEQAQQFGRADVAVGVEKVKIVRPDLR